MHKLLIAFAASAAFATSASAQEPLLDAEAAADARLVASLPSSVDVEEIAPAIDRSVDAFLNLDVGPLIDAADPYARHPGYGRPGRTLRRMGRARDPYFDARIRASIYGTTSELGRMMDSLAIAAPSIRRSMVEMQRGIAAAVDDYHHRRGGPPPGWTYEDEIHPDDEDYYDD